MKLAPVNLKYWSSSISPRLPAITILSSVKSSTFADARYAALFTVKSCEAVTPPTMFTKSPSQVKSLELSTVPSAFVNTIPLSIANSLIVQEPVTSPPAPTN